MAEQLRPRWGQPLTGIVSFIVFFVVAWITWFIFSDPRGPVASFPYPFVLYLAMMILVGVWQHIFFADWPFANISQPLRGVIETIFNLVVVWFVIHIIFYRLLGLGFNFVSQLNLNELAAAGKAILPNGTAMTLEAMKKAHFAESAVVCFVLIGFFSYPFVTLLFAKWPIKPSDLKQPQAGFAEIGYATMLTLFFYVALIVPFWGMLFGQVLGKSFGFNTMPWWKDIVGIPHVHWVFGYWEWMIIVLFMLPNVWRMKPMALIKLNQPWKGLVAFVGTVVVGYFLAWLCTVIAPAWLPHETIEHLKAAKPNDAELIRFLWYHAAEIAGFTLIPFLIWHHYFDDMVPMADKDSWAAFWFRTIGVFVVFLGINYVFFYYIDFGYWGLGNPHMEHLAEAFTHGESLVWNFWWIIPLLWNEWFFHKWPFYVHEEHH
jgi:AAT family amino acid transporter